jgi:hypothetical protein
MLTVPILEAEVIHEHQQTKDKNEINQKQLKKKLPQHLHIP